MVSTVTHGAVVGPGARRPARRRLRRQVSRSPRPDRGRTADPGRRPLTVPDGVLDRGRSAGARRRGLGTERAPDLVSGPAERREDAIAAGVDRRGRRCETVTVHTALLQYRLDTLIDPVGVPGGPRAVDVADPDRRGAGWPGWLHEFEDLHRIGATADRRRIPSSSGPAAGRGAGPGALGGGRRAGGAGRTLRGGRRHGQDRTGLHPGVSCVVTATDPRSPPPPSDRRSRPGPPSSCCSPTSTTRPRIAVVPPPRLRRGRTSSPS